MLEALGMSRAADHVYELLVPGPRRGPCRRQLHRRRERRTTTDRGATDRDLRVGRGPVRGRRPDRDVEGAADIPERQALVSTGSAVGVLALGSGQDEPDTAALGHAEVACDYTTKAEQAAEVTSDARTDPGFRDLDDAVRAVHAAGHHGDPAAYDQALGAALEACRAALR